MVSHRNGLIDIFICVTNFRSKYLECCALLRKNKRTAEVLQLTLVCTFLYTTE